LWNWLEPILKRFDDFLTKIIKALKQVQKLASAAGEVAGRVLGGGIRGAGQKLLGSRQFGGPIPETGPYLLHAGETVLPASGATFGNITVNVSGTTSDPAELARQIKKAIADDLVRFTSPTGY